MNFELIEKDYIINTIPRHYNKIDIKSIGRKLGIPEVDFFNENITLLELSDNLVQRVEQLSKCNELKNLINNDLSLNRTNFFEDFSKDYYRRDLIDNIKAKDFGEFYTALLKNLDNLEEKYFEESELIEPIKFDEKMEKKAGLSPDIINAGLLLKNDIVSLRKKANALNYTEYERLLQRIGRIYRNKICAVYPDDVIDSSIRFRELYNLLDKTVPKTVKKKCENWDMYIEGLIYDTIAHCLIFNR